MTPYYQDDAVTIYHGDCKEILPTLGRFDLLLTDPPYGIGYDASKSTQRGITPFEQFEGENETFNPSGLLNYPDVILWGANNYCNAIPPKAGQWYFWDKVLQNNKVRIAEGEFAWHKLGTKPRAFRHLWSGAYKASESGVKAEHPTQKPVMLMGWCINLSPNNPQTIIDPFAGSGTTGRAAKDLGKTAVLIEREERYCEIAAHRMGQEVLPL